MANLIGLEWDDREARVVAGTTRGSNLVVEHAFSISWPAPAEGGKPTAPPPAEIGRRLGEELAARKIPKGEALVALSRTLLELKPITLPPVPDDELPDMVKLQSQREFTSLHEGSLIDFIPLSGSSTEQRGVLAAAVSPELVKQVRAVCDAAGLKLERLTLRPCGAAALLNRAHPKAERVKLLVDLMWDDADLTVIVGDQVTYLRTVRLPVDATTGDVARPLVSEIRRTMAAAQNQLGSQRVEAVYFCGDKRQAAAAEALGKSLEQPVRAFDPFQGLELGGALRSAGVVEASRFAPLLGTLSEEAAGARPALDFLHPRRRPPQKSRTEKARPLALVAGAVLAAAALAFFYVLTGLDTQIEEKQQALAAAKQEAQRFDKIKRQHDALKKWQETDIVWLDELASISRNASPPQAVMFTGLTFDTTAAKGTPQVKVDLLARSIDDIQRIGGRMRGEGVELLSGKQGKDNKYASYPEKYDAVLTIKRLDTKAQLARLSAPLPADSEAKQESPPAASAAAPAADKPAEAKVEAAPAAAPATATTAAPAETLEVAPAQNVDSGKAVPAPQVPAPGPNGFQPQVVGPGQGYAPAALGGAATVNAVPASAAPAAPVAQPTPSGAPAPVKGN
jgi:Tfp pilus assembly PilM family ATPase